MKKVLHVAFIMTALAGMMDASAQATAAKCGGVYIGPFRGDDSVLQCEHVGKMTIKQICGEGFRVVYMQDDRGMITCMMLVTEE